ncbi:MAG TPA: MBL fold metallo-hydrolase [bacterium]|nr:MBL fold metallo-hydrolase [bacterium]HOL34517.1 MBL fold metallo-hydrolase [bacterium]HPP08071.1 MBL fold metallo-hydrolase [bacterium]
MEIVTVFDKDSNEKNLHIGWGISFLVDQVILLDTGEKGEWLVDNLDGLKINTGKIEKIVISHDHWDHTGGLWDLLKIRKRISVYGCKGFSEKFKEDVKKGGGNFIEVEGLTELKNREVFSTGEIEGDYKGKYIAEQSIIIKSKNGISILTGCAHPGILKIIDTVRDLFPDESIYAVIGGFHLIEEDRRIIEIIIEEFRKRDIKKVGATHCTGITGIELFKEEYKDDFLNIKVGEEIEV